jgi:hypothetical protein
MPWLNTVDPTYRTKTLWASRVAHVLLENNHYLHNCLTSFEIEIAIQLYPGTQGNEREGGNVNSCECQMV